MVLLVMWSPSCFITCDSYKKIFTVVRISFNKVLRGTAILQRLGLKTCLSCWSCAALTTKRTEYDHRRGGEQYHTVVPPCYRKTLMLLVTLVSINKHHLQNYGKKSDPSTAVFKFYLIILFRAKRSRFSWIWIRRKWSAMRETAVHFTFTCWKPGMRLS